MLLAADVLGLVQCPATVLERVADLLDEVAEECRPSSESFVNPAKVLAAGLGETVPVVLGDGPLTGVAASRAASMLARTARVPATHGVSARRRLPGRRLPRRAVRLRCAAARRSSGATTSSPTPTSTARPPRASACSRCATPTSTPRRATWPTPWSPRPARPASPCSSRRPARARPIERLASLVALTDFAATYLALGLGLDPAVSRHVADLRDRTG